MQMKRTFIYEFYSVVNLHVSRHLVNRIINDHKVIFRLQRMILSEYYSCQLAMDAVLSLHQCICTSKSMALVVGAYICQTLLPQSR